TTAIDPLGWAHAGHRTTGRVVACRDVGNEPTCDPPRDEHPRHGGVAAPRAWPRHARPGPWQSAYSVTRSVLRIRLGNGLTGHRGALTRAQPDDGSGLC